MEQSAVTLENTAQDPSDDVPAAGPLSFVFRGSTSKASAGAVIPSRRPFVGLSPAGTGNIVVCYDNARPLGIADTSDEVDVPPVGTQTLSQRGALPIPRWDGR